MNRVKDFGHIVKRKLSEAHHRDAQHVQQELQNVLNVFPKAEFRRQLFAKPVPRGE